MKKIVHLTSVHKRYDIRIFIKECSSLVKVGYSVSLVVADGKGDEVLDGIKIYDVGVINNRFLRIINTTRKIYNKALELNADLYHFHDPEIIPLGLKLKKSGKKVIFDSHEDFASDILNKEYIPKILRTTISKLFEIYDTKSCKKFDTIVTATPAIAKIYQTRGCKTMVINNFPIIDELSIPNIKKENAVCFVGAQTQIRGISEIISAMSKINGKMYLAGPCNDKYKSKLMTLSGWDKVDDLGLISRSEVASVLAKSIAGIVTYLPVPNHIDSQPNKLFEYMSAGIPVIASNFELWKEIIQDNDCGICVDPESVEELYEAMKFLLDNPKKAYEMGVNGKNAVENIYNWKNEENKLIDLYERLLENE